MARWKLRICFASYFQKFLLQKEANSNIDMVWIIDNSDSMHPHAEKVRTNFMARFADTVLLISLIIVNGALIRHRKMYPDMERPFRVPFVPVLPILGMLANIYLLAHSIEHRVPFIMACIALGLGMLAFVAWKGTPPCFLE